MAASLPYIRRKPVPSPSVSSTSPEPGNYYGQISVSDNAIAHLGDKHNHTYQIQQATFLDTPGRSGPTNDHIADWLSSSAYEKHQNDTFSAVQKGSGGWFLDSPDYRTWLQTPGDTLLLCGIPGAGKTCLASIVINELTNLFAEDQDTMVLFFYNSFSRQQEQSATKIMSSLLRQAFLHDTFTPRGAPAKELYEKHHKKGRCSAPDLEELSESLARIWEAYNRVFLVIDALDECLSPDEADQSLERHVLLSTLMRVQKSTHKKMSFIFTTRPPRENASIINYVQVVPVRASGHDISSYVNMRLSRSPKQIFRDPDIQSKIVHAMIKFADGMFLLAKLQIDSILSLTNRNAVLTLIDSMSRSTNLLKSAYETTLQRIKEGSQPTLAGRALSCVVFARQPLTADELRHAIAAGSRMSSLSEDDLEETTVILESCAGLLVVDEQSDVVRVVHNTTQEFLETTTDEWIHTFRHYLAQSCLSYLAMDDVKVYLSMARWVTDWRGVAHLETRHSNHFALLSYALRFWWEHVRDDSERSSWSAVTIILTSAHIITSTFRVNLSNLGYDKAQLEKFFMGHGYDLHWVHLLAWLGLLHLLEYLVVDTDLEIPSKRLPLQHKNIDFRDRCEKAALCSDLVGLTPAVYAACAGNFLIMDHMLLWSDKFQQNWNHAVQVILYQLIRHEQEQRAIHILSTMKGKSMLGRRIYRQTYDEAIKKNLPLILQMLLSDFSNHHLDADSGSATMFVTAGREGARDCIKILLDACDRRRPLARFIPDLLICLAKSSSASPDRLPLIYDLVPRFSSQINAREFWGQHGRNPESRTMLHYACEDLNQPLIDFLSAVPGINFDVLDSSGRTPLMYTCTRSSVDRSLLMFLCQRSNVNFQNPTNGWTALHEAANTVQYWGRDGAAGRFHNASAYIMMREVLCAAGAVVSVRDLEGRTAADIATLRSGERQISMRLVELEKTFGAATRPLSPPTTSEDNSATARFTNLENLKALTSTRLRAVEDRTVNLSRVERTAEEYETTIEEEVLGLPQRASDWQRTSPAWPLIPKKWRT